MIQQRLFIIAASLTVMLGVFNLSLANAATPSPSSSPSASTSASKSPSPSASANPSATPSDDDEDEDATPSPEASLKPVGKRILIWQTQWKGKSTADPVVFNPKDKKAKKKKTTKKSGKSEQSVAIAVPLPVYAATEAVNGIAGLLKGGAQASSGIGPCVRNFADGMLIANSSKYFSSKGVKLTGDDKKFNAIIGKPKAKGSYLISSPYSVTDEDSSGDWQAINVYYGVEKGNANPAFGVFYRVADSSTNDPADSGWVKLTPDKVKNVKCGSDNAKSVRYAVNNRGKVFQYKVVLSDRQRIKLLNVAVQPLGSDEEATESPSPEPSGTVSPDAGSGKITITSKIMVPNKATTTPSPSTAPLLPQFTPSPKATSTPNPSAPPKPNPACFNDDNTEPAASVPLSIRQTDGDVKVEDEQTDEDGIWRGLDGETDSFPAGTYQLKFGQFQDQDYKLVDICVTPNDGTYVRKTETGAGLSKATIIVKDGQETKVTLLYAPRNKPYITMNKFALASNNKILRVVYPGLSFRYLIRYENTSDVTAKDVRIADVIPEQYYVQGSEEQTLSSTKKFDVTTDALGRTTVVRKVGDLTKGQKGSFEIPVTLKPDAFGSPDDIAGALNLANEANQQQSSGSGSTGTETDSSTDAGATGDDLELE